MIKSYSPMIFEWNQCQYKTENSLQFINKVNPPIFIKPIGIWVKVTKWESFIPANIEEMSQLEIDAIKDYDAITVANPLIKTL